MNSDEMFALAQRIAKHQAPAQVKLNPLAAKQQLVRLSMEKLLGASTERASRFVLSSADKRLLQSMGISCR